MIDELKNDTIYQPILNLISYLESYIKNSFQIRKLHGYKSIHGYKI